MPGSRPLSAMARRTSSTSVDRSNSFDEMFTVSVSGLSNVRCHSATCRQASRITQCVSGTIRPVSSATGMNSAGGVIVPSGRFQRTSASKPHALARLQLDDRLVVDAELLALERAPELRFEREPLDRRRMHRRIERLVLAAALRLGAVHRGVGVAQQVVGAAVLRRCRRRCPCSPTRRPRGPRSRTAAAARPGAARRPPWPRADR